MNTEQDHLLACIGEEAGEIAQAVGKIQRFGSDDVWPERGCSNAEHLRKEIHDLIAVYEMYTDAPFAVDPELVMAKWVRVEKYMRYAREIGRLCYDR